MALALLFAAFGIASALNGNVTSVAATSYGVNAYPVTYTLSTPLTAVGEQISNATTSTVITFPPNYDLGNVTASDVKSTFSNVTTNRVNKVGNRLEIRWTNNCPASTSFNVTVANVRNASQPGAAYSVVGTFTTSAGNYTFSRPTNAALTAQGAIVSNIGVAMGSTMEGVPTSWTVTFTPGTNGRISGDAAAGPNTIDITLPAGTTISGSRSADDVTVNGVRAGAVSVSGLVVTVSMPAGLTISNPTSVAVRFSPRFGIVNPAAGSREMTIRTSAENIAQYHYPVFTAAPSTAMAFEPSGIPSDAIVAPGQTVLAYGFTTQRVQGLGAVNLSRLTFQDQGSNGVTPGRDVAGATLYRDDGDGVFGAGDAALGTASFVGNNLTYDLVTPETVTSSKRQYWLTHQIAASPTDGDVITPWLSGYVATTGVTVNNNIGPSNGTPALTIDAAGPAITITDPGTEGSRVATGTKTITGTAADAVTSVGSMRLRIRRDDDGYWWNGTAWQPLEATLDAVGTSSWSYAWPIVQASGDVTYTVTAVGTDAKGNVSTSQRRLVVDMAAPVLVSAAPFDRTHVDIAFSEGLQTASAETTTNYSIPGLAISGAALQPDARTVRLTTTLQTTLASYTATVSGVTDLLGHPMAAPASVDFLGSYRLQLTVTSFGQPASDTVLVGSTMVVDGFSLARTVGSEIDTITGVTIENDGTTPSSVVSGVYVYRDDGDGRPNLSRDTRINSTPGTFTGSDAVVTFDSAQYTFSTYRFWVVYTFAPGAADGATASSFVKTVAHLGDSLVNNAARGSVFTVSTAPTTLAVSSANQPPAQAAALSSDKAVDGFTMRMTGGTAPAWVSGISIHSANANAWLAVAAGTQCWRDTNGNGVWDPAADTQISIGSCYLNSSGDAYIGFATPERVTTTSRQYFVVYRFASIYSTSYSVNCKITGVSHSATTLVNGTVTSPWATLDNAFPTVGITSPVTNQQLLSGTTFSVTGTAADGLGVASVEVMILRPSDGRYWNPAIASWGTTATWIPATGTTSWSYAWQFDPAVQDGTTSYTLTARATDGAGQRTVSTAVTNVTVDNAGLPKTLTATSSARPATGTAGMGATTLVDGFTLQRTEGTHTVYVYSVTVKAGGTAQTKSVVSGVDLYRDDNGNGAYDSGVDTKVNATSATFTDDTAVITLPALGEAITSTPRRYWVAYRLSNTAPHGAQVDCLVTAFSHTANTFVNALIPGNPVTVDNTAPAIRILSPVANSTYLVGDSARVSGISGDSLSNIATVGVAVQRSDTSQFWNATTASWGAAAIYNPASGSYSWTFDWQFSPTEQTGTPSYTLYARAQDTAGNVGNAVSVPLVRVNNSFAPTTIAVRSAGAPPDGIVGRGWVRAVDGFRLSRIEGSRVASVTSVTIRDAGTAPASGVVAGVDVYRDADGDRVWQASRDTKLNDTSGVFVGAHAVVPFASAETVEDAEKQYFVVYRFSPLAPSGAVARSEVVTVTHNASEVATSVSAGSPFIVDAVAPAISISSPAGGQSFSGTSTVVSGTAADGVAGLAAVDIAVQRSGDGMYWDGTMRRWTAEAIWNATPAAGSWQYRWAFDPPAQDGARTYTVTARARDAADNTAIATVAGLTVSNGGPDTIPPSVPGEVAAVPGAFSPTVGEVTWEPSTDTVGVTSYNVWRATTTTGTFAVVGSSLTTAFGDKSGVTGQRYFYKVSALDAAGNESALSASSEGVVATWHQPPHATYDSTDLCLDCHATHSAGTKDNIFRASSERTTCYACHDGTGAAGNVKTGRDDSFALWSGHSLEETTTSPDLTNACSGCHSPHRDWQKRQRLAKDSINGTTVAGNDATWCLACHNDAQDWYVRKSGAYPALDSPSRDASGYPIAGTFPGRSVYTDPAKNAHARIPAASEPATRAVGDCRHCHAAHRGVSTYDGLLATFTPPAAVTLAADRTEGSYAAACFGCHDGSRETSGAPDIKRFVTYGGAADGETSGHRIKSAGALLPVNAPLPCYDCHNPHGSSRGNARLISDVLGANLDTTPSAGPAGVRRFCLSCHTTWERYGWDSLTATYTVVGSGVRVEGLRRDGGTLGSGPDGGYNFLRLKNTPGHGVGDTAKSCYTCHGSDYSSPSSGNVHRPWPGGGVRCYTCHDSYKVMDMADPNATSSHHHVLGSNPTTYSGDTTAYPTSKSEVYCLSCHADHDVFAENVGANLRTGIGAASTDVTNTDFIAGASGASGVCLSCHELQLDKRTAYQKNAVPGPARTPALDTTGYAGSVHRYQVMGEFGGSTFRADCVKCHNDTRKKEFQTAGESKRFGTHDSAEGRLLASFGVATADPMEERACYGCHSRATDGTGSVWTPASPTDFYGAAAMTTASVGVYASEDKSYGHITGRYTKIHRPNPAEETTAWIATNKHVECADCHNVHAARSGGHSKGTNRVSGALTGVSGLAVSTTANWSAPSYSYVATATYEYEICIKCHSGANAGLSAWDDGAPASWTDVALEFNTKNHSFHPVFGALNSPGSGSSTLKPAQLGNGWSPGMTMYCTDCHADDAYSPTSAGPHGSASPHLLKGPNRNWPAGSSEPYYGQYQLGLTAGQEAGLFCLNCHPNLNSTNSNLTNTVHTGSSHRYDPNGSSSYRYRGACTTCHLLVPHGGKIGRLLAGPGAPARYKGPSPTPAAIGLFSKPAGGNYMTNAPYSGGSNCSAVGCGSINHAQAAGLTYESW